MTEAESAPLSPAPPRRRAGRLLAIGAVLLLVVAGIAVFQLVPGENRYSATVDHARTVVRRAERHVVACVDAGYVSGEDLLPWLNRLSDILFVLARSAERRTAKTR